MKTAMSILIIALMASTLISCVTKTRTMDNVVLDTNAALPILHLNGTAYENGLQHGKLLQQEIHALVGLWKQDLAEKYQLPADTFITRFLNSTNYIPAIEKWTPELLDEVKGISQGAGMEFNTLFAFQLIDEIWTNGKFINNAHHCTSVGINNYKKDGSSNFIAQNIDVTPFYHGFEVLLDIQDRKSGTRKLVTTFAGYIGINGINRQIGVTENSLTALKSAKDGLPVCFVSRGILEKKSFDEAVSFVKQVKHASGQNYTIGSTHHIISLECAADLITEYWPDSSKLYTFHANRPLTNTSYHASYVDLSHVYGIDHRFETMKNKLLNQKSIGLATIKDALATKPICNTNTFASTIMEFHTDYSELHIASGNLDSLAYMQLRIDK